MIKKWWSLILVAVCALLLTGCSKNNEVPERCEICDSAYRLVHKRALESYHGQDYYYYSYKCTVCESEFTIELIAEQEDYVQFQSQI